MTDAQPTIPIWGTVTAAYRTGIGLLYRDGALFRYFVYASLLSALVFGVHLYWIGSHLSSAAVIAPLPEVVVGLLLYIGYAVAANPFAVAVHRKILLGETPRDLYLLAVMGRPRRRFLLATATVYGVFFVAGFSGNLLVLLIYGLNPFDQAQLTAAMTAQPTFAVLVIGLTWVADMAAALIAARLTFAFPAVAIDAPGASLRQSFAAARGSTWRLFFIFVFIFVGPFIVFVVGYSATSVALVVSDPEIMREPTALETALLTSPPFLVLYALMFVMMMALIAVVAAAAARAYEIRVNRGMTGVAEVFA